MGVSLAETVADCMHPNYFLELSLRMVGDGDGDGEVEEGRRQ